MTTKINIQSVRDKTNFIESMIQEILSETEKELDCKFLVKINEEGKFKLFAVIDREKYSLT
jgi:hypothetical protein